MGKLKLSLITNVKSRKAVFKKRKRGILKQLDQLTTLCGVEAFAVIKSPYDPTPEAWPSKEAVEEVASRIPDLQCHTKMRMDHETYLEQRISKEKDKERKLCQINREFQMRQIMFDCIEKGKINEYHYNDARDLQDLKRYMSYYTSQLNQRIKDLTNNGEASSSSIPHLPVVASDADHHPAGAADVTPPLVASHAAPVTAPKAFLDHMQFYNMVMPLNQREPVQHQVTADFTDQIQNGMHAMHLNQEIDFDLNQYPEQEKSFMDLLVKQSEQMGDVGEHASIACVDGKLPTTTNR